MPVDATTLISTEQLAWQRSRADPAGHLGSCPAASINRGLNERDLVKQLLLHLPRFRPKNCLGEITSFEADRLARKMQKLQDGFSTWTSIPS